MPVVLSDASRVMSTAGSGRKMADSIHAKTVLVAPTLNPRQSTIVALASADFRIIRPA